jgi:hypothetical protein
VDVEVPQKPVHDIRNLERLGVVFATGDTKAPEVLALRKDFPNVAHLNLRPWTFPKSLCLYDVPFRDVRAQWTPARFVARVREWLRLTARGELHGTDQPLEPLLGDWRGWIILPRALRVDATTTASARPAATPLCIERLPDHRGKYVLVASLLDERPEGREVEGSSGVVATSVLIAPRPFAAMRSAPATLAELHEMLAEGGDDLVGILRTRLAELGRSKVVLDATFALVLLVPVKRSSQDAVENTEAWAFITNTRIAALGVALGLWELKGGVPGFLLPPDTRRFGENVRMDLLSPVFTLSREDAAVQNGRVGPSDTRITAVGGGTLGSQLLLNSVRAAFGRWTVIDDDLLLPHNLARHALPAGATGFSKADSLATFANQLTNDVSICSGIVADVLDPGESAEAVAVALEVAEVIVDVSASVPVARMLARDITSRARRVSLYLNPAGTDLTLLAEDVNRTASLDILEMQYYRALIQRAELRGALAEPPSRIRYGRSCRDVSAQLSGSLAAMYGGIAARALEQTIAAPGPRLRVWRVDESSLSVTSIEVEPAMTRTCVIGDWTVITDDSLLQRLALLRMAKLPNETGGVLVGAFDLHRRIVYVIDTVPSPPDSCEWPMLYIRGCAGLEAEIRQIEAMTAGQLHYVGEWHSHPEGHGCLPSGDDATVFAWLTEKMDVDGIPGLMMIVGDDGLAVPYLGRMVRDGSYPAMLKPS